MICFYMRFKNNVSRFFLRFYDFLNIIEKFTYLFKFYNLVTLDVTFYYIYINIVYTLMNPMLHVI